ncbi:DUF2855 family protein [Sphingomonas cavernae]|uniref:DUF2855 family protein n=1 Tax=Sphingomonas cavernae TaxID=2320861 RepID=A0A418W6I3_9SPHN|nr:DUF2855 family protein [Sphingomonas cavernae]RJF85619.1 DUF2855 family protein [Sphingomonas cavernae]
MSEARWAVDVDRDEIAKAGIVDEGARELGDGEIEVRLDEFAMTANNVTYAALGHPVGLFGNGKGYWDFFSGDGAGRLPVWGFATVTRSRVEGLDPGELLYGYFPLASHAVLTPDRVGPAGFTDQTAHRLDMPAVYNQYQRVAALGDYAEADREWWPVFRPLYLTGWLIADQFEDEGDYGAEQVIVASASAKTAISFAHAMRERAQRPRMIGLTSERGRAFLEATGLYDELVLYDTISDIDASVPSAFVDVAGNSTVTGAVHEHLGDALRFSLVVGKAHWDATGEGGKRWPAVGFFAPGRIQKRSQDWGAGGFRERVAAAWTNFLGDARKLFHIDKRMGPDAALAAYREAVAGKADPRAGVIVAL